LLDRQVERGDGQRELVDLLLGAAHHHPVDAPGQLPALLRRQQDFLGHALAPLGVKGLRPGANQILRAHPAGRLTVIVVAERIRQIRRLQPVKLKGYGRLAADHQREAGILPVGASDREVLVAGDRIGPGRNITGCEHERVVRPDRVAVDIFGPGQKRDRVGGIRQRGKLDAQRLVVPDFRPPFGLRRDHDPVLEGIRVHRRAELNCGATAWPDVRSAIARIGIGDAGIGNRTECRRLSGRQRGIAGSAARLRADVDRVDSLHRQRIRRRERHLRAVIAPAEDSRHPLPEAKERERPFRAGLIHRLAEGDPHRAIQ